MLFMTSLSCVPKWSTKIKSALSSYLAFAVHPTAICLIVLNVLLFKKELPYGSPLLLLYPSRLTFHLHQEINGSVKRRQSAIMKKGPERVEG